MAWRTFVNFSLIKVPAKLTKVPQRPMNLTKARAFPQVSGLRQIVKPDGSLSSGLTRRIPVLTRENGILSSTPTFGTRRRPPSGGRACAWVCARANTTPTPTTSRTETGHG
jgi:hypothetical protein